jgi:hypothetical protein
MRQSRIMRLASRTAASSRYGLPCIASCAHEAAAISRRSASSSRGAFKHASSGSVIGRGGLNLSSSSPRVLSRMALGRALLHRRRWCAPRQCHFVSVHLRDAGGEVDSVPLPSQNLRLRRKLRPCDSGLLTYERNAVAKLSQPVGQRAAYLRFKGRSAAAGRGGYPASMLANEVGKGGL